MLPLLPPFARYPLQVVSFPVSQPLQPDAFDKLAATSREWAHAVLVNSCVATKNLQHKAAQVGEQVQAYVASLTAGPSSNSA